MSQPEQSKTQPTRKSGSPIVTALGGVLTFALGVAVGGAWALSHPNLSPVASTTPPTASSPFASITTPDGTVVQYDPSASVSIQSSESSSRGGASLDTTFAGEATSAGLDTSSDKLAAEFETGAPSVGSTTGGHLISSIRASTGTSLMAIYLVGAGCVVAGIYLLVGMRPPMPTKGMALIIGGVAIFAMAYLSENAPWVWYIIGVLGLAYIGWWLYDATIASRNKEALVATTAAVQAAGRVDSKAAELVKSLVPEMAGKKRISAVTSTIDKAKQ